jgi:hypothetical protein
MEPLAQSCGPAFFVNCDKNNKYLHVICNLGEQRCTCHESCEIASAELRLCLHERFDETRGGHATSTTARLGLGDRITTFSCECFLSLCYMCRIASL